MNTHYVPIEAPATPEYVLEVMRDMDRQYHAYEHDGIPERPLTFATTIEDWFIGYLTTSWSDMVDWLNELWDIRVPKREWKAVLHPIKEKRMGGVCEFIAERAWRPLICPMRIMGSECKSAGAFLTIRSCLEDAGAKVAKIAPSTPLDFYTARYYRQLISLFSKVAPGKLPRMYSSSGMSSKYAWSLLLGGLTVIAGHAFSQFLAICAGWLIFWAGLILMILVSMLSPPPDVQFGRLYTFRDLAKALADGHPDPLAS